MPTVTKQIQTGLADGIEFDNGTTVSTFGIITFGGQYTGRLAFLRFTNIDIPQGATIISAYLKVIGSSQSGIPPDITLYAENNANGAVLLPGGFNFNISGRASTTNTVAWANPFNPIVNLQQYTSPDLKTIIQEVINLSDWQPNNPINIITDVGAGTSTYASVYAFEANPSLSAVLEISYVVASSGLAATGQPKTKQFIHKIYDKDNAYITTWSKEVINKPKFKWSINGGMGEMVIDLKRQFRDFSEGVQVKFGNIVKTYIQDSDQAKGKKIWEGVINRYEPTVNANGMEIIRVIATSWMLDMQNRLVKDAANNTNVTYSSEDPSAILKSIVNSTAAGSILKVGDVDDTGTTVTYTFQGNTIAQSFQDILKLTPQYWYFWIDAENKINLKEANFDETTHNFYIGKEVSQIRATKSNELLTNRVYFMGGGDPNLYLTYQRTSSQSEWGTRELFIKDERVTVAATAKTISDRYLDDYDHPISEMELEVVDNNIDPVNGYDIETLKPGDIVQVFHPQMEFDYSKWDDAIWDVDYWDYNVSGSLTQPHQIQEISYMFNKAVIKIGSKIEEVAQRIEDIERNLGVTSQENLPNAPS